MSSESKCEKNSGNAPLSGIQPTSEFHLGNWMAVVRHRITQQALVEPLFLPADLHAITRSLDLRELRQKTLSTAAAAVGGN